MDQDICCAENAQYLDVHSLQQYFLNNRSNLLQTEIDGHKLVWTYPAGDTHAAEKAGWMLRRLGLNSFIHAQKVRLKPQLRDVQEAMVITVYPANTQLIYSLETLCNLNCSRLEDEALKALETSLRR